MRENRLFEIEQYIRNNERAELNELCNHFDVSLNTIRRDLAELVKRGTVKKVYGGVVSNQESAIIPFDERNFTLLNEKAHIGKLAATLVKSGDTIYIDSGTTAPLLLPYLGESIKATIVSNSQIVYAEAEKYPNLQIISPGGLYNAKTQSFVGNSTVIALQSYQFAFAFMAATAFSLDGGAMNNSYHESEVKKAVIARSKQIALMIDDSKIEKRAGISFCPLDNINYLISNKPLPKRYEIALGHLNINLIS